MDCTWVFFIIIFRKALFPERLPNLKPKITKRSSVHKSSMVNSWCLPFPGSDRSVMMRTQRARYHTDNKRPVQISSHVQISSLFYVALTIIAGFFFGILAKFKLGRKLLEAFPGFFSFGTVSKQVINILCFFHFSSQGTHSFSIFDIKTNLINQSVCKYSSAEIIFQ